MPIDIDPGKKLREYQSGIVEPEKQDRFASLAVGPDGNFLNAPVPQQQPSLADYLNSTTTPNYYAEDYTDEARAAGFGRSRYDDDYAPGMDLEQNRALSQSNAAKIFTGLGKMGVTAGTTALETTLGSIFGLGSALYELASDSNGNGRSFMDTLDSGVNNWLSNQLIKIQQWSEEVMPNYRTEEERSEEYQREWYKHMGTANFIGDSILKNFGFTVGAIGGGLAWSKLIGAGLSKQLANNIMKGAVVAAEGNAEAGTAMQTAAELVQQGKNRAAKQALRRAGEALERGTAVGVDSDAIVENVKNAAKALNKYNAKMQLYGAAIGAVGEGTVEGIMAKDEFLQDYNSRLQQQYAREYNSIEQDVLNSNDSRYTHLVGIAGPEGKIVRYENRLKDEGLAEVQRRQREVTDKYQKLMSESEEEGDRLSSTTFLLNLPILTTSNLVQFGKMFSGGWSTARNALTHDVSGGIAKNAGKLVADYAAEGKPVVKGILGSLKVAGSEASEEMLQGTASSGAKRVADYKLDALEHRLSGFNDAGYDEESVDSVRSWFENMYEGGAEYLGDIKNWQEGALGAITGLFGIPGRRWNGGVIGSFQEAKEEFNASKEAADRLNTLVNSEEFQTKWHDYIRHLKYNSDMQRAVINDDEYAWHTAADEQLINDVMTFADAGKLDDLNQVVDYFASISPSDASTIRDVMKRQDENNWTKNLSDQEVVDKVKKQAKDIKKTIGEYKDVYNAIASRAPIGSSPEFLKETVFTAMRIKDMDERFLTLFGETMNAVEPWLRVISALDDKGNPIDSSEEAIKRYENLRNAYERLFAGTVLPVKLPAAIQKEIDSSLDTLESITESDPEVSKKLKDMRKLSESRKEFYRKLQTLQSKSGQEKFEKEAITQEKVNTAAEKAFVDQQTEGLTTIGAIKEQYASSNNKGELVDMLRTKASTDNAASEFVKMYDSMNHFRAELIDKHPEIVDRNTGDLGYAANLLLDRVFHDSASETDFINKLLNAQFGNKADFDSDVDRLVQAGSLPEEYAMPLLRDRMYENAIIAMRTLGKDFASSWKNTNGNKNVSGNVDDNKTKTSSEPKTPDAPEVSSQSKKPTAEEGKKETGEPAAENPATITTTDETVDNDSVPSEPTAEEELEDSLSSYQDTTPDEADSEIEDRKGDAKVGYYQQSIPEIELYDKKNKANFEVVKALLKTIQNPPTSNQDEIKKLISQVNEQLRKTLKDFVTFDENGNPTSNATYAPIYKWLQDKGAFDYIATKLNINDKLVFCTMDDCPTKSQIIVGVVKSRNADGEITEIQPLTTLSQPNSIASEARMRYAYLDELYDAMRKDYMNSEPDGMWVFGGKKNPITSNVFGIRQGLIPLGNQNRDIRDIPGYTDSAPIIMYDHDNNPVVLRGKLDMSKVNLPARSNLKRGSRAGRIYYMVRNGDGTYMPVLLHPRVEDIIEEVVLDDGTIEQVARKNIEGYNEISKDISKAISEGKLESDVEMLRQKGINFLFDPWNPVTGKFERLIGVAPKAETVSFDAELGEVNTTERNAAVTEKDRIPYEASTNQSNTNTEPVELSEEELNDMISKDYEELNQKYLDILKQKNLSKEMWNSSGQNERESLLGC